MFNDEMRPIERMQAFDTGQPLDRIPFVPLLGETAVPIIDKKISEYRHSAQLMVDVEIAVYEMLGQDGVGVGPGYQGLAEAMGTRLSYPENDIPFVIGPAIEDWAALDVMEPVDPRTTGKMPLYLEALKILKDKLGQDVPVGSFIGGPLSTAAFVRGTDHLLRDLRKNTEQVHRLMQLVTDSALRYIDAVLDLECSVSIADPVASGTMISAASFREFVQPYLKQMADRVHERTSGGPMLHICGNTARIWPDMVATGASVLSLDNVIDMGAAKKSVGQDVCIMGNVDPVNVVAKGTRQDIYDAVQHCIAQSHDSPKGFILSTGCQIPLGTPIENIQYFADAARSLGRHPISAKQAQKKCVEA